MSKTFYHAEFPAWHQFELIVRDALKTHLPGGDYAGLLLNRRLGHESASEADLLYAGTTEGKNVAVIVECKNRPIEASGCTIHLPSRNSEAPIDLMASLELKAHHARTLLGIEHVRFMVVGCTKTPFSVRITPDIFAVGQPIARWSDSTAEQDFSPLISTWLETINGIEALRLDSEAYAKLRNLPKFAPWDTVEAEESRNDLESERMYCEMDELMGEHEVGYEERLRRFASDREQSRFLEDA
jgi:hypothetical protein